MSNIKVEAQPHLPLLNSDWGIDAKPLFSNDSPLREEPELLERSPSSAKVVMEAVDLPKPKTGRRKTAPPPVVPVLIDHLPAAWDEAHGTFDVLERCVYERKDLGLSKEQDEMMVCDCVFDRRECGVIGYVLPSLKFDVTFRVGSCV